jgi:hydroxymethylglutaryl-CoA lyase
MGFESAYGDEWSIELMLSWISRFKSMGLKTFPISDILGDTTADQIGKVFSAFVNEFPELEFGLHLHSLADSQIAKVDAAYKAGIRRFDTVVNGLGGCPQTGRELVGNLPLQSLLYYFNKEGIENPLDMKQVEKAAGYRF